MTVASGIGSTNQMSGWGNGIADLDNDGWKDLFVARANVMDNISELNSARRYPEPNSLFRNVGKGKFVDLSSTAGPDFQLEAAHRGDKQAAEQTYRATVSALDKAIQKGTLHENTAARYKSRLGARVNAMK